MKGFEPVELSWRGLPYLVPAENQMRLIAEVEDALCAGTGLQAIQVLTRRGGPSYSRLSCAFGAALRYAGCHVSDEEVYLSIQEDFAASNSELAEKVQSAVLALLSILSPPIARSVRGTQSPEKAPGVVPPPA
jgi:hypothetical protein